MLFNSYEFLFLFLPICLGFFFLAGRLDREIAIIWLVLASLFFYGWWNPAYLILILFSMIVNFVLGKVLTLSFKRGEKLRTKSYLVFGLTVNLGVLAYYKYAGFFVQNVNALTGSQIGLGEIVLPLAISFFTFQQIAYLVDASRGITHEYRFSHYALFVTFFPQLIAGPIVHHKEMLPQFMRRKTVTFQLDNLAIGLTILFIGLFKKVVLADGIAQYASPVFNSAANGASLTFFEAWGGALAYTMQLYFDFSGYSDMAIGAARLFGIRLPLNFYSPYKATNIVEFWRRWHMTLSRFLRDYLYVSLGGNRRGRTRRYTNLFVTMLLGGLWHGAGWTFVIWGGLHGCYLVINHAWRWCKEITGINGNAFPRVSKFVAWFLTFNAVVISWVFFRASDFDTAMVILKSMSGLDGIVVPNGIMVRLGAFGLWLQDIGLGVSLGGGSVLVFTYIWIFALLFTALIMPNTQQLLIRFSPVLTSYSSENKNSISLADNFIAWLRWKPTPIWSVIIGLIAALSILALTNVSEFLYFQF